MKPDIKYLFATLMMGAFMASSQSIFSQYLQNGSLEGTPNQDYIPPDYWMIDGADIGISDPNVLDLYTSNDGIVYYPVDGTVFILLRARGVYYNEPHHGPHQREYLYQQLLNPLEKNTCFQLSSFLCTNTNYNVLDTENPNIGFPLKFQVWGSDQPNGRDILLVDSDPISNTGWQKFTFFFTTPDFPISYLLIECQWDTYNVRTEPYNGMLLVDNMTLTKISETDTLNEYTLFYHGDNMDTLTASGGNSYLWSPSEYVNFPDNQSVVVTSYHENISVLVTPQNACSFVNDYHLILNCDTIYPNDTNRVINHYYRYEEDIILEASEGMTYNWEPEINLTGYDIQAPRLTSFHDQYSVVITNKYNCVFNEYFNIILSCDTLYPGTTIAVLDTLLQSDATITLIPRHGVVNAPWQPAKYLSCNGCQNPIASPPSSISYRVSLKDEFNCIHNEVFTIKIDLRIPNTITPNDDGFNDCLKVYGLPDGSSFRLYDKQGLLVYFRDPYNPDDCWNGVDRQGNPLSADNYWFAFEHPEQGIISTGFLFIKR